MKNWSSLVLGAAAAAALVVYLLSPRRPPRARPRCPSCGHEPHLPGVCYEDVSASWPQIVAAGFEPVFCGCEPLCPSCGSDQRVEPEFCACGHPCHKRQSCEGKLYRMNGFVHESKPCRCDYGPPGQRLPRG